MFNGKEVHLYNHFGTKTQSAMIAHAILNTPLNSFPYREEEVKGNARSLNASDVGKKFKVSFFDSYDFGTAEFLGFGLDFLPVELVSQIFFYGREKMFSKWCVFKNSHNFIAVNPFHCDVHST